jgi:glycosyltransferase involved in cell wall biosynthesis
MKKALKILTILPYKENYTRSKAQAAAIWVYDFLKFSRFKNSTLVVGNTNTTNYLSKNYLNVKINNLGSKFSSSTIKYCAEIIKKTQKIDIDLVEIHNRPLVFKYLSKHLNKKFILYFHNDPLSMKGSFSKNDRLYLLKNIDKIIFVSRWVQNRFFIGLDQKLLNKTEVVYPSISLIKRFPLKKKWISFVGKLNSSKGYDIYKDAILRILNEFNDWSALSIGDESRDRPHIEHKKHKEIGFKTHKSVLALLAKSQIAVVPSRWEEPFGRTALESGSRGCATIISNRGGLPETTAHSIILENLNSKNLYQKIKYLIQNPKKRIKIQKNSFNNVLHKVKDNSKLIDNIRESIFFKINLDIKKKNLRIINIYNTGQKLNHRLYNISLGKKFTNGFIRNGHDVLEISDRDYIKQTRGLSLKSNKVKFQDYLLNTYKNYNPDLVFFGHTNNIDLETIYEFKKINTDVVLSHWNEDPIMTGLDYSKKNLSNIEKYSSIVDNNFITSHPSVLKHQNISNKKFHFLFIPVDKNIECFNVYNMNPVKDLFYAMSHGVNRGVLKRGKSDNRINFLNNLINKLDGINYDFYGFENKDPIWGNEFYKSLINSKMGLNLSRGKPTKYYSSNRIASLVGNGLLTFVDRNTNLDDFFNENEIIFYNNIGDLADKIKFYKKNESQRIKISRNGQKKYFKLFNEQKIAKYIVDRSYGKKINLI